MSSFSPKVNGNNGRRNQNKGQSNHIKPQEANLSHLDNQTRNKKAGAAQKRLSHIISSDLSTLSVQFTQVRKGVNGRKQRVTVQQDFNDEEEMENFLKDIENLMLSTKKAEKTKSSQVLVKEKNEPSIKRKDDRVYDNVQAQMSEIINVKQKPVRDYYHFAENESSSSTNNTMSAQETRSVNSHKKRIFSRRRGIGSSKEAKKGRIYKQFQTCFYNVPPANVQIPCRKKVFRHSTFITTTRSDDPIDYSSVNYNRASINTAPINKSMSTLVNDWKVPQHVRSNAMNGTNVRDDFITKKNEDIYNKFSNAYHPMNIRDFRVKYFHPNQRPKQPGPYSINEVTYGSNIKQQPDRSSNFRHCNLMRLPR